MSKNINLYKYYTFLSISAVFCFLIEPAHAWEITNFNFYESNRVPPQKLSPTDSSVKSAESEDRTIYIKRSKDQIALSISDREINFGVLSPGEPFLRSHTISLPQTKSIGINLYISEDKSPTASTGAQLPDTRCDDGTCSELLGAAWKSALAYGLGFRCDRLSGNALCAKDFSNKSFYRQFANEDANEMKVKILSVKEDSRASRTEITYKINIASSQEKNAYNNTVTILGLPAL